MFDKIAALLFVAAIIGSAWIFDGVGYSRAERKYLAQIEATKAANDLAIQTSADALAAGVEAIRKENQRQEDEAARLDAQADLDAAAACEPFSADRVRRVKALD